MVYSLGSKLPFANRLLDLLTEGWVEERIVEFEKLEAEGEEWDETDFWPEGWNESAGKVSETRGDLGDRRARTPEGQEETSYDSDPLEGWDLSPFPMATSEQFVPAAWNLPTNTELRELERAGNFELLNYYLSQRVL